MKCRYCGEPVAAERVELGYDWCKNDSCSRAGIADNNRIVLVCGHKAGYQPMFLDQVKIEATHPRR